MRTTLFVIVLHLLLLIPLFSTHKPTPIKPTHVTVHTVQLEKRVVQPKPIPAAPKPKPVVAKPKSQPKPVATKPKATPPPKQENSELLALMEQSLHGLEKVKQKSSSTSAPTKVGPLKSESLSETSYEQMLVSYLQERLQFPENGEVKVKLTVTRSGTIAKSIILLTSSKINERYINEHLEQIALPSFGTSFKGEREHTFALTLTSR